MREIYSDTNKPQEMEKISNKHLTLYLRNWKKKDKEYSKLAKGKKSKTRELQT